MQTSDGIAIIELQNRRIGCLFMMFFNVFFVLHITPFWQDSNERRWKYHPANVFRNTVRNIVATASQPVQQRSS
jgi:hypothetical protein